MNRRREMASRDGNSIRLCRRVVRREFSSAYRVNKYGRTYIAIVIDFGGRGFWGFIRVVELQVREERCYRGERIV